MQSFEGQQIQNRWIYHTVALRGSDLTIERGYSGYPGMHGATETSLIVMLVEAPEVALVEWSVVYGGEGYDSGQAAGGKSAAELLAYLRYP